jgi:ABC-type proline/glycine betaine transport system permease subunit
VAELSALTLDHLVLVLVSLAAAIVLGVPMGIAAARFRKAGQIELGAVGMLQTIPALALLVFMIPLFGIGKGPALVALSLYALLPIVRSTYAGLIGIDGHLLEIAFVLGLGRVARLVRIELPLASIGIMAGIKTSAVMTVGTATLAAFIGGGGYGTLIARLSRRYGDDPGWRGARGCHGRGLPRDLRAPGPLAVLAVSGASPSFQQGVEAPAEGDHLPPDREPRAIHSGRSKKGGCARRMPTGAPIRWR